MPASCPPRRSGRGSDSAAKAQRHGCPAQGCGLRRATAGARTPALARQSWAACPVRWRRPVPGWYARIVTPIPVLGGELAGPWFRVQSIVVRRSAASAEHDFLDILPAVAAAARAGRPLVAGWLCRAAAAAGRMSRKSCSAEAAPRRATMDWTRNQGPANSPPRTGVGVTMCAYQPDTAAATDTGSLPPGLAGQEPESGRPCRGAASP